MPKEGDGFFEHYGVWAILITDPLILLTTTIAFRRFDDVFETLPFRDKESRIHLVEHIVPRFIRHLNFERKTVFAYFLCVIVGFFVWLVNLHQTKSTAMAIETYGNAVFDSRDHFWGYLANKINLFNSWVIVYPLVLFQLVAMSISLFVILKKIELKRLLKPYVLHPDGCYGLSYLGLLNIFLLFPYVLMYIAMWFLTLTHENDYLTMTLAQILVTSVVLGVSIITIYPITKLGRDIGDKTEDKLIRQSIDHRDRPEKLDSRFAFERVCYASSRPSPYTRWSAQVISFTRAVPVLLTALKALL